MTADNIEQVLFRRSVYFACCQGKAKLPSSVTAVSQHNLFVLSDAMTFGLYVISLAPVCRILKFSF